MPRAPRGSWCEGRTMRDGAAGSGGRQGERRDRTDEDVLPDEPESERLSSRLRGLPRASAARQRSKDAPYRSGADQNRTGGPLSAKPTRERASTQHVRNGESNSPAKQAHPGNFSQVPRKMAHEASGEMSALQPSRARAQHPKHWWSTSENAAGSGTSRAIVRSGRGEPGART